MLSPLGLIGVGLMIVSTVWIGRTALLLANRPKDQAHPPTSGALIRLWGIPLAIEVIGIICLKLGLN